MKTDNEMIHRLLDLATKAYENYNFLEAIDHYEQLLAEGYSETVTKLTLAHIKLQLGLWEEAQSILEALSGVKDSLTASQQARLSWLQGELLSYTGEHDVALSHLSDAESYFVSDGEDKDLVDCWISIARIQMFSGQLDKSNETLQNAIQKAQSASYQSGLIRAINDSGRILSRQGDTEMSLDISERARELAIDADDKYNLLIVNNDLAGIYVNTGQYVEAIQYCRQAYELAEEIGYLYVQGILIGNLSEIYRINGNFREAISCALWSIGFALDTNNVVGALFYSGVLGNILSVIGDSERAITFFEQSLRIADLTNSISMPGYCPIIYDYAQNLLDVGKHNLHPAIVEKAINIAREINDPDTLLRATILHIYGQWKLNALVMTDTKEKLESLIKDDTEESHLALIHYTIAQVDNTDSVARSKACTLYKQLYSNFAVYEYKQRHNEICDEILPDLPHLPKISDVFNGNIPTYHNLLSRLATFHAD